MFRKNIFSIIILSALSNHISAQIWKPVTPFPDPRIIMLSAPDSIHLKAIQLDLTQNYYTSFLYSDDGGTTWQNVQYNAPISKMYFLTDLNGWITSDSGRILHTTDGGQTWNAIQINTNKFLSIIQFLNDSVGFVLCQGTDSIFVTHDGGSIWSGFKTGLTYQPTKLLFIDSLRGWIITGIYDPYIHHTVDGGITWVTDTLPSQMGGYKNNGICFTDSLNGWINGSGAIMRTHDGGNSWNNISTVIGGDIAFIDTLNGVRVEYSMNVFHTTDGGITWNQVVTNPGYDIDHANGDPVISICDDGYMINGGGNSLFSSDGVNWRFITNNGFPNFINLDVGAILKMSSAATGIFVTPTSCTNNSCGNTTYVTSDSGKFWHHTSQWFLTRDVFTLNDSNWYVIHSYYNGDSCTLYKSTDQMNTVQALSTIYHQKRAVYFFDTLHAVIAGDSIFYSNDGGLNWIPAVENSFPAYSDFRSISFIDSLNGWALSSNFLAKTTDGGHSWNLIYTDPLSSFYFQKLQFTDALNGYILCYYGPIIKTTDGGVSFTNVSFPTSIYDFAFTDSQNGWLATDSGIYYSNDGLVTFQLQDSHPVNCISFTDSVHGYSVAPYLFLSTDQSSIINHVDNVSDVINSIKLYPNPALDIINLSTVEIIKDVEIINVTGHHMLSKHINNRNAGIKTLDFPAGIYIIKIYFEKNISYRKFILGSR
jgi:photosystem II stability/assembly factor-like uncharacterized protein